MTTCEVQQIKRSPLLFPFHPNVLQDDDDGHLLALQIIRDLVDKGGDLFLDQLARLGVISKVSTLAGPSSDDENEEESKPEKVSTELIALFVPVKPTLLVQFSLL